MNSNRLLLCTAIFAATLAVPAAEPAKPPCCTEACAEKAAPAPSRPLAARSIYQLDATWTNDAGEPVTLAALRGRPVVLTMFFANCEYACPMLVADMHRVRAALPAEVRARTQFVLVSFDPARDTPAALQAYRSSRALDDSWTLLRGEAGAVQELAMLLGVKFKQDARGQFSHSNVITILNPEGEITFQRSGLQGDALEPARAVVAAAR